MTMLAWWAPGAAPGLPLLRRRAMILAVAGVTALAVSCGAPARARALPAPPRVVHVTMRDFSFDYDHHMPAGRTVFRAFNAGRVDHELGLWPLSDDFPPIEAQLHGSVRRALTPFARSEIVPPGKDGTFAVDLLPGRRYATICFVHGAEGQHEQLGMATEFRTEGPKP